MEAKDKELVFRLQSEFQNSRPPVKPNDILPGTEAYDETQAFWCKDWDDLSVQIFDENRYCFGFFPISSFSYFFGALLYHMVREGKYQNAALDMMVTFWDEDAEDENSSVSESGGGDVELIKTQYLKRILSSIGVNGVNLLNDFFCLQRKRVDPKECEALLNLINDLRSLAN